MIRLTRWKGTAGTWPAWAWTDQLPPETRAMAVYRYLTRQLLPYQGPRNRIISLAWAVTLLTGVIPILLPQIQDLHTATFISAGVSLWLMFAPSALDFRLLEVAHVQLLAHPLDAATRQTLEQFLARATRGRLSFPQDRAIRTALCFVPVSRSGPYTQRDYPGNTTARWEDNSVQQASQADSAQQ